MIPAYNGRNLAAWGLSPCDPDVANMTIRDTDIPSHADINQSNGPMLSVRHHIPILIHAPSRHIIRLYIMYSAFFKVVYIERGCVIKWSKSFQRSYLGF